MASLVDGMQQLWANTDESAEAKAEVGAGGGAADAAAGAVRAAEADGVASGEKVEEDAGAGTGGGVLHGHRALVEDGRILTLPFPGAGDGTTRRIRIVHLSDTHCKHAEYNNRIPDGDILVHSGDFAKRLRDHEFAKQCEGFNKWLGKLPHKHKIFVAGNHEVAFNDKSKDEIQAALPNCTYLQDDAVVVEGLRVYGSPWTSSRHMGFSSRHLRRKWAAIPADTDVLITHMPPFATHDLAWVRDRDNSGKPCPTCTQVHPQYRHWGCHHLLEAVLTRVRPRVHLFGHVHDANGHSFRDGVLFVNSSMDLEPRVHVVDVYVPVATAHHGAAAAAGSSL